MSPLAFVGAVIWKTLVVRHGVRWVSPTGNDRAERATWWSAFSVVLLLGTLGIVSQILHAIFPFALPLYWLTFSVTFFLVFAEYYGLGIWRAAWMFPVLVIGDWAWQIIARWVGF